MYKQQYISKVSIPTVLCTYRVLITISCLSNVWNLWEMLLKNAIVLEKQSSRRRYNCVQSIQPRIGFVSRLNLGHLVLSTGATTTQLVASLPVATPHLLVFLRPIWLPRFALLFSGFWIVQPSRAREVSILLASPTQFSCQPSMLGLDYIEVHI